MKKIYLILFLAITYSAIGQEIAQSTLKNKKKYQEWLIGLNGGIYNTSLILEENSTRKSANSFGLILQYYPIRFLSFEFNPMFTNTSIAFSNYYIESGVSTKAYNYKVDIDYFQIPLTTKLHLGFRSFNFFIGGGFYYGFPYRYWISKSDATTNNSVETVANSTPYEV